METPPPRGPEEAGISIYTLLCDRHVDLALGCLRTFHRYCRDPFRHLIIDDGSITPRSKDRLNEAFPATTILSREEVEDRIGPRLRDKPHCRHYREHHSFALKLIDSALLSPGAFAQCDSDILFLRPFRGFDRGSIGGEDIAFMKDVTTAYSISYLNRHFRADNLKLPQFVNAGFMYIKGGIFDIDFIEWFLGREEFKRHVWVMEQTAWAAIAGRCRPFYYTREQMTFPLKSKAEAYRDDWVGLHFTSPLRARLEDAGFLDEVERRSAAHRGEVATLRTVPALETGPIRDLGTRLYYRLRPPAY